MSENVENSQNNNSESRNPASLTIASKGIKDTKDFANLMCGLMCDVIEQKITPDVVNAACNAGGKLLKSIELEQKYGQPQGNKVINFQA